MGRIIATGMYLIVIALFVSTAVAQTPATQPTTTASPPPTVPPVTPTPRPAMPNNPPPGVYWNTNPPPPGREYQGREYYYETHEPNFPRNHFELSLGGQGYTAFGHHGSDSLGFVTLGADYYFLNGLSIGLEGGLSPRVDDRHDHGDFHHDDSGLRAEELIGLLRWHFLDCGSLSFYGEVGLGGFHADHHFPSGGREDSGLGVAGLGASWRVISHLYISGGARYARIGDDWDDDHRRSHGFDGVQYYGEISFVP
jgi:hypothetical protein